MPAAYFALAKGWGPFSIQNTFSGNLPASGMNLLGRAFLWNTAFQCGLKCKIWSMIEQNSVFFLGGPRFRQEADVSDTRGCFRDVSNRRATVLCNWRWRADRRNTLPHRIIAGFGSFASLFEKPPTLAFPPDLRRIFSRTSSLQSQSKMIADPDSFGGCPGQ